MKAQEIISKHGWDKVKARAFINYLEQHGVKKALFGDDYDINYGDVGEYTNDFLKNVEQYLAAEDRAVFDAIKAEENRVKELIDNMPITSGTNFEGYRITRYGGYVSGDEVVTISDSLFSGTGFNKDVINDKIKKVRQVAIKELKAEAAELGCNAVIALDFDYITLDRSRVGVVQNNINESYIALTANGTAVEIEKL